MYQFPQFMVRLSRRVNFALSSKIRNFFITLFALFTVTVSHAQTTAPTDVAGLVTQATSGVGGIQNAVFTILGIALAIGLGVWAVRKLKPKG